MTVCVAVYESACVVFLFLLVSLVTPVYNGRGARACVCVCVGMCVCVCVSVLGLTVVYWY